MSTTVRTPPVALKLSAILWVIWGLGHVAAGVMIITADATSAVAISADGVDPALLQADYPEAVNGILNQNGFNLLWGGAVTTAGALFIWREYATAVFLNALVGGLLDLGYLLFIDLPGYNNFVPGRVMTIVSGSAILLSFYAYFGSDTFERVTAEQTG